MWNWALSQLSSVWFFPKGKMQQLLWHLAVERNDGWQESLKVGTARSSSPPFHVIFFFCLLTSKRLLRQVFLCWKYKALMGTVVLKLTVTLHLAIDEDHRKANCFCMLFLKKEKLQSWLSPKCYLHILPLDLFLFIPKWHSTLPTACSSVLYLTPVLAL